MKMDKEAKILGSREQRNTIDDLVRRAGKDKVINEVIEGKKEELPNSDKKYKGIRLSYDHTIDFYTEGQRDSYEDACLHEKTINYHWSDSPLTHEEIIERARKFWGGKIRWLEHAIDKYLEDLFIQENEKPVIGFYHHGMAGGLAAVAKTFEEEGIPSETGECICVYAADRLAEISSDLPKTVVIKPSYDFEGCWKGLRKIIEANPETQFYMSFTDLPISQTVGSHLNLTYFLTRNKFHSAMQKLLEKFKKEKNEQRS